MSPGISREGLATWTVFETGQEPGATTRTKVMGAAMRVTNWIVILDCAYMEYTSWCGKNVYRRTVPYDRVVWC